MRHVDEIIVHCTATRPEWWADKNTDQKRNEIKRWHVEGNGWSDIGYHFLIDRDGTVIEGRPVERTGAHVRGHNTGTVGISLFGGHGSSENDAFEDHFTVSQDMALRKLIEKLKAVHPTIKTVSGHNQYAAKACPGFNVPRWLARKSPTRPLAATKTVAGGTMAGVGQAGNMLLDQATEIEAVIEYAPSLQWVFTGLILAGVALVIYSRVTDYRRGRK